MAKVTCMKRGFHPTPPRKLLDLKLGYLLLGDRRVPVGFKIAAFAIGIAGFAILGAIEFPVEEVMAMALPVLGILGDFALDGVEAFIIPILLACLSLPYLAPGSVVDRVCRERAGIVDSPEEGPIIDV